MNAKTPRCYLAGPAVFHPAAKALLDYLVERCAEHGLEGVRPVDCDVTIADPMARAAAIRRGNAELIRSSDVVVACISPFRGPGADAGTAWEMGFAEALGKAVVPWCEETAAYSARVPHDRDADGRLFCRQHGMLVEDFGLVDNLMLTAGPIPVQADFDAALVEAARLAGV